MFGLPVDEGLGAGTVLTVAAAGRLVAPAGLLALEGASIARVAGPVGGMDTFGGLAADAGGVTWLVAAGWVARIGGADPSALIVAVGVGVGHWGLGWG